MHRTAGILTIISSIPTALFVPYNGPRVGAISGWQAKTDDPVEELRLILVSLEVISSKKKWPTKDVYHFDVELTDEELVKLNAVQNV
jgi:hypothetical protein